MLIFILKAIGVFAVLLVVALLIFSLLKALFKLDNEKAAAYLCVLYLGVMAGLITSLIK